MANRDDSGGGLEPADCPVCGPAPNFVWMDEGGPARYLRCAECRTIFSSPRLDATSRLELLNSAFGPGPRALLNATRRRPALEAEARIIQHYVSEGRMLDIGCDLGGFFEFFPDPHWARHGVEILPGAAAYAADVAKASVRAGTLGGAAYADSHFDLVTLIDVIYHLEDPLSELEEIHRVLSPRGILAIEIAGQSYQMLRSRGPICLIVDGRWTRLDPCSAHLVWMRASGLNQLLARAGFESLSHHPIGIPNATSAWRQMLSAIYGRSTAVAFRLSAGFLDWVPKYLLIARRAD